MPTNVDEVVSIDSLTQERLASLGFASPGLNPTRPDTAACSEPDIVAPILLADHEDFAQQQLCALIQRVFFPGWPKPSRQVVVSAADAQCDSSFVCARLAHEMARSLSGSTGVVEADLHSPGMARLLAGPRTDVIETSSNGSIAISKNLWLLKPEKIIGRDDDGLNSVWLQARMNELRRNFDYTLVHAPSACLAEAVLLGQLADGLILVVQARKTRRAVAQKALEILRAANVTVLGTVLTDRTFPIPEKLYQKL